MWETILTIPFIVDFLVSTIRMTTPLAFAGLSCVISERSGIFNIGVEGMMLGGAFAAAIGALYTGNAWMGIAFAVMVGVFMGLLLAVLSISLGANQIVSGIMINVLALGLTSFFARITMGSIVTKKLPDLGFWSIPLLDRIPIAGKVLFQESPLSFISYGAAILLTLVFFKTTWGLAIRASGEHPAAVDSAGINVAVVRYVCVTASGVLAALGGAFLSVALVRYFTENVSAGRGFIGLTIVILGKWHPLAALAAAVLFGAVDALQLRIQTFNIGIPYQFLVMLPYVCGLIAISGVVGRSRSPAAVGKPYRKEE